MPLDLDVAYQSLRAMGAALVAWLPRLFAALVIVALAVVAARAARWTAQRSLHHRVQHENLQLAVGRMAYAAALAVGMLVASTIAFPSFTIGSLIQLLGVSGVVVGFAFKDIFQNFLAGILLLVTNPFAIGDQIIVDAFEGTVEEIQARATLITTYDRRRVVVPNADLFTKSVTVNTAFPLRRVSYDVTVQGAEDVRMLQQLLERTVRSGLEGVEPDPVATVLLIGLTASGMTYRLRWWSSSERGEYLIVQSRVLTAVYEALRAAQLKIV
jgi:small conductance mechanosensitive channel